MIKAVLFDMDDTLFSELEYIKSGFRAVAHWASHHINLDYQNGYNQLVTLYDKGIRGDTFNQWLKTYNIQPDDYILEMVDEYRNHMPDIQPFPEIEHLLSELMQDYKIGLISDGYLMTQKKKWDVLGLSEFFSSVIFSDQWGKNYWKPHPKPFIESLTHLNVQSNESIYIADNPQKDFIGANQLGLFTIRLKIPHGVYSHIVPETPDHQPHMEISKLSQLVNCITAINRC